MQKGMAARREAKAAGIKANAGVPSKDFLGRNLDDKRVFLLIIRVLDGV